MLPPLNPPSPEQTKRTLRHTKKIPITSDLFFAASTEVWILKLRRAGLAGETRWDEVEGTDGCAHLYGNFGAADVVAVRRFARSTPGQAWSEAYRAAAAADGGDVWLE